MATNKLLTLVLVLILGSTSQSCSNSEFSVPKPDNVPSEAQLVGGPEGWEWIDCKNTSPIHLTCSLYNQKGVHERTSFLRPCFNIRYRENEPYKANSIFETVLQVSTPLFEYRPSDVLIGKNKNEISKKYYDLLGVDDTCKPVSNVTELIEVFR